jgi:hypothetical protein
VEIPVLLVEMAAPATYPEAGGVVLGMAAMVVLADKEVR